MTESEAQGIWDAVPHEWRDKFVMNSIKEMVEDHDLNFFTYLGRGETPYENFFQLGLFKGLNEQLMSVNLRSEFLETFSDDPRNYLDKILKAAEAMRAFADELEALTREENRDVR